MTLNQELKVDNKAVSEVWRPTVASLTIKDSTMKRDKPADVAMELGAEIRARPDGDLSPDGRQRVRVCTRHGQVTWMRGRSNGIVFRKV